ncbi:MAG: O-antigen ligase family protein [Cyanobacteriota bacterium]
MGESSQITNAVKLSLTKSDSLSKSLSAFVDTFLNIQVLIIGLASTLLAIFVAVSRPKILLYLIFALAPTQWLFINISFFFISPADILVVAGAVGVIFRLIVGRPSPLTAVWQHKYLALMVLTYLLGFLLQSFVSLTLIRLVLGIIPSILACELIKTRRDLMNATSSLVASGVIVSIYGIGLYLSGVRLHPTRFAVFGGPNFTAMYLMIAATISFAQFSRTKAPIKLVLPGWLIGLCLATLSRTSILAFIVAWLGFLGRITRKTNKFLLLLAAILLLMLVVSQDALLAQIIERNQPALYVNGVEYNIDVRWPILQVAWDGFRESPILGIGYHRFLEYSTINLGKYIGSSSGIGYYTHNTFIEVLVEGGLLAFSFFVMHYLQYVNGYRLIIGSMIRNRDTIAIASLAALSVLVLSATFINLLTDYTFWSVSGLSLACINLLKKERRSTLMHSEMTSGR